MTILGTILLFSSLKLFAPEYRCVYLHENAPLNGFKTLIDAVVYVESRGDNWAVNVKEQAMGAFQIRGIRVLHYNRLTGKNYQLSDMFDYEIAKEVFMYFAVRLQEWESIARRWNGSGPMTDDYWNKVKARL